MNQPIVSCIMVTRAAIDRFEWIRSSLADYCRQTHQPTELIVVLDAPQPDDRQRLELLLANLRRPDIRLVVPKAKLPLGALRNKGLDNARGNLFCVWDDDDAHHPRRIELQLEYMTATGAGAVLLSDCLHLFMNDGCCFWVDWGRSHLRGLPGTLLSRLDHSVRYAESGRYAQLGEDMDFLRRLTSVVPTESLRAPPFLYLYRFHGKNTWHLEQHQMVAIRFSAMKQRLLADRDMLAGSLESLGIDPRGVTMADATGPLYSWRESKR
jgi:glycosyltransferase involved in cell wall biosynthesis